MYFVYTLQSVKYERLYIGSTNSVPKRIIRHNKGFVLSTKPYRPWKLIKTEYFPTLKEARNRERYLKSLKSPEYAKKVLGIGTIVLSRADP